ncbi:hypothetical protein pb186bvf_009840 [Paramecium bursaria]
MRILYLSLLVMVAIGLQSNPQGQLKNEKSRYEKLIAKFMELAELSEDFNFNKLYTAIDDLTTSLRKSQNDENILFDQEHKQYIQDVNYYSDLITFYSVEVAQHTQDLEFLNNQLVQFQAQLKTKQEELQQTYKQKAQLEEIIKQNEIAFNKELANFNSAIDIVDQALQILGQLRNNPSFIQYEQLEKIGNGLSAVNFKSHRFIYEPIAQLLLQVAQDRLADQELVKKVIGSLQSLRNTLDAGRVSLISNYNAEKASNEKLLKSYVDKIDYIENTVIPSLQAEILDTQDNIKIKTILLTDAQNNLDDATANLKWVEETWQKRVLKHQALVREYDLELALIADAVKTLEKGGVRRS